MTKPLDYAVRANRSLRVPITLSLVTFLGAWGTLAFCYIADELTISYPSLVPLAAADVLFAAPLALLIAGYVAMRREPLFKRMALSISCMAAGTVFAILLIVLIYSPFHHSIQNPG